MQLYNCKESCIPTQKVEIYPNNKPWINNSLEEIIKREHDLFKKGSIEENREAKRLVRAKNVKSQTNTKTKLNRNVIAMILEVSGMVCQS